MKIRTVADLKRIPVGTRLRLVRSLMGPTDKPRVVAKVQTNAIAFRTEKDSLSWLTIPKAKDFELTENGFRVWDTWDPGGPQEKREIGAEYVFEVPAESAPQ
jgi:hypothetical protein